MAHTGMSSKFQPRRSCLYVPSSNARAMEKARAINADAIILDLEDAVAPDAKPAARVAACEAVAGEGFGRRAAVIRINALESEWGAEDLKQAVRACPDAVLVPKVTSGADIRAIDAAMIEAGREAGAKPEVALWAMIETPLAILNIREIAASTADTSLSCLVMGTNDLAIGLRAQITADRAAFQSALQQTVIAARGHGLAVIDGVYNDISNLQGLEEECRQGRVLGFDGKTLIHPAQIDICNAAYSPTAAEVEQARAVIAAFADPANAGQGVIKVDGKMTEYLHLEEARRIVATAQSIEELAM